MTTEVAVINRLGVALATDSAVTITGAGKSKVFDSGDKLFELDCGDDPVGIMINGNMDLLGVPWELIIKDFKSELGAVASSIRGYLQHFLDFADRHKACNASGEARFVEVFAREEFDRIRLSARARLLRGEVTAKSTTDIRKLYLDEAANTLRFFESKGPAVSIRSVTSEDVLAAHGGLLDGLIEEFFEHANLGARQKIQLRDTVVAGLLSAAASAYSTGIIVAGYAPGDMFPSIAIVEADGTVCGKLKYVFGEHVVLDRDRTPPGRVISFAQTDVADRLLSGADAEFVRKSAEFFSASLKSSRNVIVEGLKLSGESAADAAAMFDALAAAVSEEYRNKFAAIAREDFQRHFNEMVALMPKQEVLELAEALVSITAIERKASSEQETVGGPVDVAFITRHEGFVWIKRKLYFPPDLNQHRLWRKLARVQPGDRS